MKKTYILDTNVLLSDHNCLYQYSNNDIIIPFKVLEELDKFKKRPDIVGSNARSVIRILDDLCKKGNLSNGVRIHKGKGNLYTRGTSEILVSKEFNIENPDNVIINVALFEIKNNPSKKVVIVTKDINLRVKSNSLGVLNEDYEQNQTIDNRSNLYTGFTTHLVDDQTIDLFYTDKDVFIDAEEKKMYPNQFVMLISNYDNKKTALAQFIDYNKPLQKIKEFKGKDSIWGIHARNKEQVFAGNLLMNQSIPFVTLVGRSGTGKTMLSIAAGLQQTIEEKRYKKIIISRPIQSVGADIGFMPGDKREKMTPWLSPFFDNLENLVKDQRTIDEMLDKKIIEIEAVSHIRGRSISNAFIIIDETQNIGNNEVKTIVTRVGENSKIVLIGDVDQIDNSFLNELTNGLTIAVEKFKDYDISGHMTLEKGERSKVATIASKIL